MCLARDLTTRKVWRAQLSIGLLHQDKVSPLRSLVTWRENVVFTTKSRAHSCVPLVLIGPMKSQPKSPQIIGLSDAYIIIRTKKSLRDGDCTVPGDQWPLLIYKNYVYDPENPWHGVFRSSILVKVCVSNQGLWLYLLMLRKWWPVVQAHFYISKLRRTRSKGHAVGECSYPWHGPRDKWLPGLRRNSGMSLTDISLSVYLMVDLGQIRINFVPNFHQIRHHNWLREIL